MIVETRNNRFAATNTGYDGVFLVYSVSSITKTTEISANVANLRPCRAHSGPAVPRDGEGMNTIYQHQITEEGVVLSAEIALPIPSIVSEVV